MTEPHLLEALARLRASNLPEARQAAFRKEALVIEHAGADGSALVDRIDAAIAAQLEEVKMRVTPTQFHELANTADEARQAWRQHRDADAWRLLRLLQDDTASLLLAILADATAAVPAAEVERMVAAGYTAHAARYELAIRVLDPKRAKERAD